MNAPSIQARSSSAKSTIAPWLLAFALILEIALTSPFFVKDFGPSEINHFVLFGILQFPYLISLIALFIGTPISQGLARGTAMAVSVAAFLAESVLALGATLLWSWTVKDDHTTYLLLLLLICTNILIFIASIRLRNGQPVATSVAFVGIAVYCLLIPSTMGSAWNVQRKDAENARSAEFAAARGLRSLTACLHEGKLRNPSSEYPASLQLIAAVPICNSDFAKINTFTYYTLQYIPLHAPTTGQVTAFQLVATPKGFRRSGLEPLFADDSGMVAELSGWSNLEPKTRMRPLFSEGHTTALVAAAKSFADKDPNHRPPLTFDDLVGPSSVLQGHGPTGSLGTKFQSGDFSLEYFPPASRDSAQFSIAATCSFYGTQCLRSYLFESSGDIHFTAEKRAATHDDPLISAACLIQGDCPNLKWPVL